MNSANIPALHNRLCPICNGHSSDVWMDSNVDFDTLDRFAFASRKFPEYMHFRLLRCQSCDLLYVSPAPDLKWVQSAYREADFDAIEESAYAARTYRSELDRILSKIPGRTAALDIGAGDGAFLFELLNAGFSKLVGIEPSHEPLKRARVEVRELLRNEFFTYDSFPAASFDLVTCFQTLEHVDSPFQLCAAINRMLTPGGAFFTVAHDYRALLARFLGKHSPIYDVEHLQLFSMLSLKHLLETAGFEKVAVWPLRNTYPISYWLRLLPLPQKLKNLLSRVREARLGSTPLSLKVGNIVAVGFRR